MKEIKTEKFIENTISIRWFAPLTRQNITAWNLLNLMLAGRTEKFDTREKISKAAFHAYGLRNGYGLTGYGDKLMIEYRISWIRPDLVDDPEYPQEVLTMMDQMLNHHDFKEEHLTEAKYLLSNRLSQLLQDPDSRALQEAMAAAGKGTKLEIRMQGYLEDLDSITLDQIQELYESLKTLPQDTYVVGMLSDQVRAYLSQNFPGQPLQTTWSALQAKETAPEVVLEKEISQSSLVQIYETGILPQDPDYFALIVLNALLGSSSVSLLFEIIREQHSYCYSISSSLIRFDGVMVISTATDREHLAGVKKLIGQIIDDVRTLNYSKETFETVKGEICDTTAGQKDAPLGMLEQEFLNGILNRPITADQIIEKISAVTREEVARAADKLKLAASAQLIQKEVDMDGQDLAA